MKLYCGVKTTRCKIVRLGLIVMLIMSRYACCTIGFNWGEISVGQVRGNFFRQSSAVSLYTSTAVEIAYAQRKIDWSLYQVPGIGLSLSSHPILTLRVKHYKKSLKSLPAVKIL